MDFLEKRAVGVVLICDQDKTLTEGAFPILFDPLLGLISCAKTALA
jgi:hypothetical protein